MGYFLPNNVNIPNDDVEPVVSSVRTFRPMNPASSILSATFVDADPPSIGSSRSNTAMLYWVEGSDNNTVEAYARYSMFIGESGSTEAAILGGPWKPTLSVGHYMYGDTYSTPDGSRTFAVNVTILTIFPND